MTYISLHTAIILIKWWYILKPKRRWYYKFLNLLFLMHGHPLNFIVKVSWSYYTSIIYHFWNVFVAFPFLYFPIFTDCGLVCVSVLRWPVNRVSCTWNTFSLSLTYFVMRTHGKGGEWDAVYLSIPLNIAK